MTQRSLRMFCALAVGALALPLSTFAGTATAGKESKSIIEQSKEDWITGDIGVDVYSQYVFRGMVLENQGAIIQPYADIYFKLYEGDGLLNEATLNLGIWNSFHSNHTVSSSTRGWYEFDFMAGVSLRFDKFTFTPSYIAYMSPGDYFDTAHALQLKVAFDDKDLLGSWALNPYALVEFEVENKSGNGSDEGVYYEVGIAPGTEVGPVSVSIPIRAGFGSNDYYAGDGGFGYFAAGVALGYTLDFIPEKLGAWSVNANATYYRFGDCCDNADGVKNGDDHTFVFGGGLRIDF